MDKTKSCKETIWEITQVTTFPSPQSHMNRGYRAPNTTARSANETGTFSLTEAHTAVSFLHHARTSERSLKENHIPPPHLSVTQEKLQHKSTPTACIVSYHSCSASFRQEHAPAACRSSRYRCKQEQPFPQTVITAPLNPTQIHSSEPGA